MHVEVVDEGEEPWGIDETPVDDGDQEVEVCRDAE